MCFVYLHHFYHYYLTDMTFANEKKKIGYEIIGGWTKFEKGGIDNIRGSP